MSHHSPLHWHSLASATIAGLAAACVAPLETPDAGADVGRAAGLEHAIEFRVCEGPVDALPATDATLSLVEAVHLAVERDAALQADLARVQIALADARQARLLPNPILEFALRFPNSGHVEIDTRVSQPLAGILARPRATSAADQRLRGAVAQSVATALDVLANVRASYAAVQALDELLPLIRERRQSFERLIEIAQGRLELGEAARSDVTPLLAERAEVEVLIADLELERREARLTLARQIGEPSSAAEWSVDAWVALPNANQDEASWISTALTRRPEIQARVLELGALGDEAALAALWRWDGAAIGLDEEFRGHDDVSRGPSLSIAAPFFDRGRARRDRSNAAVIAARHELADLSRSVVEEVRRALAAFETAQRNLERVRDELLPLQRQRREEVEELLLGGWSDITPLLLAERDLQATQVKLVELEQRATLSQIRLERAAGGPAVARDIREGRNAIDSNSRP